MLVSTEVISKEEDAQTRRQEKEKIYKNAQETKGRGQRISESHCLVLIAPPAEKKILIGVIDGFYSLK